MRQAFCEALLRYQSRPDFVFLTGDLGYGALEPLQQAMGSRFINAGVAEQNMVSVAAGLARQNLRPWIYSIAPFVFARPFEQIRNDVCMHRLPVVLVGNGGGYGYGVMGSTHHAIEDYGVLLTLAGMEVFIPSFDRDIHDIAPQLFENSQPAYLRLGLSEQPTSVSPSAFAPWRKLIDGSAGTLIVVGPIAGSVWGQSLDLPTSRRPGIWCLSYLPLTTMPVELLDDIANSRQLLIAEEHVAQGSAGHAIAMELVKLHIVPETFKHVTAQGYPSGRYGSQKFHRKECGLDAASLLSAFDRGVSA